jgi:hypothetical protein
MKFRISKCMERSTFKWGQHGRFAQTNIPATERPAEAASPSHAQPIELHTCISQRALSGPAVLGAGAQGASRRSLVKSPCRANMLPQSLFARVCSRWPTQWVTCNAWPASGRRSCGSFAEFHSREAFAFSNRAWSYKAWP